MQPLGPRMQPARVVTSPRRFDCNMKPVELSLLLNLGPKGVSRHWGSKRYWALPATSSELKCLDICWPSTKRAPAIPPISGHSPIRTVFGSEASCRPPSNCAGCSLASPILRRRGSASGPLLTGNRSLWRRAQSGGCTNAGAGSPDPAPPSVPANGEADVETLRPVDRQVQRPSLPRRWRHTLHVGRVNRCGHDLCPPPACGCIPWMEPRLGARNAGVAPRFILWG
jgi:hypothetical protein